MVAMSLASGYIDFSLSNDVFWFQRSGALIVLAGANLQYSKLVSLWRMALEREMAIEHVESQISSGQGISMLAMAKESVQTRDFAIRIHDVVTEKSMKDVIAIFLIVLGTVVWGYGDLPFKNQGSTNHSTGSAATNAAGR
jgi:hypothetical protein